jgi:hypothetical protein
MFSKKRDEYKGISNAWEEAKKEIGIAFIKENI